MSIGHVVIDGKRTTWSATPFVTGLIWAAGFASLDQFAASVVRQREVWDWSARWADTVSGRLNAVALRNFSRPALVKLAETFCPD